LEAYKQFLDIFGKAAKPRVFCLQPHGLLTFCQFRHRNSSSRYARRSKPQYFICMKS